MKGKGRWVKGAMYHFCISAISLRGHIARAMTSPSA